MVLRQLRSRMRRRLGQGLLVTWLAALLVPGNASLLAQEKAKTPDPPAAVPAGQAATTNEPEAATIPPEQLDSLVAPIALYPDNLLAQVLAASTYPLEIIQLQQWMTKNPNLKDKALADAVAKQPWDPSVQSMAAVPEVVKRLADDIQWTTDLGNAFLAQQSDVMDAVQRMRVKAKDKGALESNEKMKVETKVVEEKTVIIVESSDPEVIYVPSYSPTVVYGAAPYYPYPPIYYPPYPPGGAFISFGVGMWMGAAIWGGSCCGCGWGGNDVNINVNNNFNRNNINTGNIGRGSGNNWSHNSQHRGGTPYSNKATASKYGGSARGDSLSSRQAKAGQQGGSKASAGNRAASPSTANRSGSAGAGAGNRAASPSAGNRAAGGGASASTANRAGGGSGASRGGSDSIGSRSIPSSSGSRGSSGFSGGSRGYSGSSAWSSSSRGASSMGSRSGGGFSRGGGGGRGRR